MNVPIDAVYPPESVFSHSRAWGFLFSSATEALAFRAAHPHSIVIVQLENPDQGEAQRAASNRIPVLLKIHSLQGAFDALKIAGVEWVYFDVQQDKPVVDVAYLQRAHEMGQRIVVSFPNLRACVEKKNVSALENVRKILRLCAAYNVNVALASFAREKDETLNEGEKKALAHYLGGTSFSFGEGEA